MPTLLDLQRAGQAVWLDFLSRDYMNSNGLQNAIDQGVRGVTANPTIVDNAISGSTEYDDDIRRLSRQGRATPEIYEAIVSQDIPRAADLFHPVFEATDGGDGYVSLEVEPDLAHDTARTISRVRQLVTLLDRPNIMIKVPATPEGIPAIEELVYQGLNINITLIFSQDQYHQVSEAYLRGLERRLSDGHEISWIASVASFFVSRVDMAVDRLLQERGERELQGKIAIDNARVAYAYFQDVVASPRWQVLAARGGRVQRPLWASTSTKNPAYPDTMYVDNLIGVDTVNTMPEKTLQDFLDHGHLTNALTEHVEQAWQELRRLEQLDIDFGRVTDELLDDGITIFAKSYEHMMQTIEQKRIAFGGPEAKAA